MELIWKNGQILTREPSGRGRDHETPSPRQNHPQFLTDLHGAQLVSLHKVTKPETSSSFQPYPVSPHPMSLEKNLSQKTMMERLTKNPEHPARTHAVNFSLLRGQVMFKAFDVPNNSGTRLPRTSSCPGFSRTEVQKSNERSATSTCNPSTVVEAPKGSKNTTNPQNHRCSTKKEGSVVPNCQPIDEALRDEQSAALGRTDERKGKRPSRQVEKQTHEGIGSAEILVPFSIPSCSTSSEGDSNHPVYTLRSTYEGTQELESLSDDANEESDDTMREKPAKKRGGTKRKRPAEVYNLSKRRQREKINKKMRELRELMPFSKKADKVSMLDEAIEYLKTLQLQIQMMSMGTGYCMSPVMLPLGIQQMNAPQLPQYSPLGMRMNVPPVYSPTQFLQSPIPTATPFNGFCGATRMLGFPGQRMLISASYSPFFLSHKCPPTPSIPFPAVSGAKPIPKSASLSTLDGLMKNTSQEQVKSADAVSPRIPTSCQMSNEMPKGFAPMQGNN